MGEKLVVEIDLETGAFDKKIDKLPAKARKIAKDMAEAWVGGSIALGTTAVMAAGNFESAMANVATVLDKKAGVSLAKLKEGILALPPELGTATEMASGMYQALSSGIDASKAVAFTAEAAKLAKAGLADMGSTVKALTGFVNAYGASSKSAAEVSDMMFRTVQLGVVELPELAAGLGNIASTAAAAQVSQKDLLAAIAATTVKGVPAAQAMTGLKAALANLIEPQEKAMEAAKKLGMEGFGPTMLASKGFAGTIDEIARATGGNAEKINALFGSVEAGGVIAALAAEKGNAYKSTLEAMGASAGATQGAFLEQTKTFNAKMEALKSTLDRLFIGIGNEYLPAITSAVEQLSQNLNGLKVLAEAVLLPVRAAVALGQGIGKAAGTTAAVGGSLLHGEFGLAKQAGERAMADTQSSREGLGFGGKFGLNILEALPGGAGISALAGFRAEGGPVSAGKPYVVGEKGPEVLVPGTSGTVLPGTAGIGGGPQDPFESLRQRARQAFHSGADAGLKSGITEGGDKGIGNKGEKETLVGMAFERSKGAMKDALMHGDVKGAIQSFGKGLADTAKSMLGDALSGLLGGLFGGGGGFLGKLFKKRAEGGPVSAGQPYIVGEERPELFVPKVPGVIVPSLAGPGGPSITIENLTLTAGPGPGGVQSLEDIALRLEERARAGRSTYFPRKIQAAG